MRPHSWEAGWPCKRALQGGRSNKSWSHAEVPLTDVSEFEGLCCEKGWVGLRRPCRARPTMFIVPLTHDNAVFAFVLRWNVTICKTNTVVHGVLSMTTYAVLRRHRLVTRMLSDTLWRLLFRMPPSTHHMHSDHHVNRPLLFISTNQPVATSYYSYDKKKSTGFIYIYVYVLPTTPFFLSASPVMRSVYDSLSGLRVI